MMPTSRPCFCELYLREMRIRPRSSSDLSSVLSIWGGNEPSLGLLARSMSKHRVQNQPQCCLQRAFGVTQPHGDVAVTPPTHRQLLLQADAEVFGLVGLQLLQWDPRLPDELVVAELVLITDRNPGDTGQHEHSTAISVSLLLGTPPGVPLPPLPPMFPCSWP